jgi:hypothetical protein
MKKNTDKIKLRLSEEHKELEAGYTTMTGFWNILILLIILDIIYLTNEMNIYVKIAYIITIQC